MARCPPMGQVGAHPIHNCVFRALQPWKLWTRPEDSTSQEECCAQHFPPFSLILAKQVIKTQKNFEEMPTWKFSWWAWIQESKVWVLSFSQRYCGEWPFLLQAPGWCLRSSPWTREVKEWRSPKKASQCESKKLSTWEELQRFTGHCSGTQGKESCWRKSFWHPEASCFWSSSPDFSAPSEQALPKDFSNREIPSNPEVFCFKSPFSLTQSLQVCSKDVWPNTAAWICSEELVWEHQRNSRLYWSVFQAAWS